MGEKHLGCKKSYRGPCLAHITAWFHYSTIVVGGITGVWHIWVTSFIWSWLAAHNPKFSCWAWWDWKSFPSSMTPWFSLGCSLQGRGETLILVEVHKNIGLLFMSDRKIENGIEKCHRVSSSSLILSFVNWSAVVKRELSFLHAGLCLLVNLGPYPDLWPPSVFNCWFVVCIRN